MFPGDLLSPLLGDHPLVLHVALVTQDHPLHVLVGVLINVPQPLGDVVKALGVGDIIHQHDPHGPAVIACCNCMEPEGNNKSFVQYFIVSVSFSPLLTSRVPNLKLYFLSSEFDCFDLEIYSNCGDKGGVECILRKPVEILLVFINIKTQNLPEQDASLAHSGVSN